MPETSFDTLIQSEKAHMESLYDKLEHDISDAKDSENSSRNYVLSNKYEDQLLRRTEISAKRRKTARKRKVYTMFYFASRILLTLNCKTMTTPKQGITFYPTAHLLMNRIISAKMEKTL